MTLRLHPSKTGLGVPAWLLALGLCASNLTFGADPQPKPAKPVATPMNAVPSFSRFQYIFDWNIFDANRVGRGSNEPASPPPQVISLVGTLQYEKGLFALFTSSEPDDQKAVKVGDTIGDFTVGQVTSQGVDLVRAGKHASLQVGQALTKRVGGDWVASGEVETPVSGMTGMSPSTNNTPAIPADASDILKRLMEKRQQELKQ